jgi:hypothetical protein
LVTMNLNTLLSSTEGLEAADWPSTIVVEAFQDSSDGANEQAEFSTVNPDTQYLRQIQATSWVQSQWQKYSPFETNCNSLFFEIVSGVSWELETLHPKSATNWYTLRLQWKLQIETTGVQSSQL